jgi:hypothetical protein
LQRRETRVTAPCNGYPAVHDRDGRAMANIVRMRRPLASTGLADEILA